MTLKEGLNGGRKAAAAAADLKSVLRMQHLQNLSLWAGGAGQASIPCCAAFLGNRLATCGEDTGIPLDPSLFPCQRCETILQPGSNCTVRIETNRAKVRRRRNRLSIPSKNNVIYTCHFCSHRNVKRGTSKHHMKEIFDSKLKPVLGLESTCSGQHLFRSKSAIKGSKGSDMNIVATTLPQPIPFTNSNPNPNSSVAHTEENSPTTPKMVLLEAKKKRKKKPGSISKGQVGSENITSTPNAEKVAGESIKRRRKSWSSLKEIAENSETSKNRNITNLTLPFFI